MVQFPKRLMRGHAFRLRPIALVVTATLTLSGCWLFDDNDASTSTPSTPSTPSTTKGVAADPYIGGARVFCDKDDNGSLSIGDEESTAFTTNKGEFTFVNACAYSIIVESILNISKHYAVNGDQISPFEGMLKAPAGSSVVTPLTTLLAAGMSEIEILAALGITLAPGEELKTLDVNKNQSALAASVLVQQLITDLRIAGIGGENALKVSELLANSLKGMRLIYDNGNLDTNVLANVVENIGISATDSSFYVLNSKLVFNAARTAQLNNEGFYESTALIQGLKDSFNFSARKQSGEDVTDLVAAIEEVIISDNNINDIKEGNPIAVNSTVDVGSEMTIEGKLVGIAATGGTLTFTEAEDNTNAGVAIDGIYTYNAPAVMTTFIDKLKFTVTEGDNTSEPGIVTFNIYPYYDMSEVSLNGGEAVSLYEFSSAGIVAASTTGTAIESVNFTLMEKGQPLGESHEKNVKVAMQFIKDNEELSVALDKVRLYKDEQGLRISYPKDAHMYGYYTNGTQTASTESANLKEDLVKTVVMTKGDTTFDQLRVQLGNMADQFDDSIVKDSPLIAGAATGIYVSTFIIDGVKVGSADDNMLLGRKNITIRNPDGSFITVSGSGVTGNVVFSYDNYFDMSNVSLNGGDPVSISEFRMNGITAGGVAGIESVSFNLMEEGNPLGTDDKEDVQVAMSFESEDSNEELSVALDKVRLYKDEQGLRIDYPKDARMYGYYRNGDQTTSTESVNLNEDLVKTAVKTNGDTSFTQLNVQLKKMADQFDDSDTVKNSPLINGGKGSYKATFVIDGIDVGSDGKPIGHQTITINNPGGSSFTVQGRGVNGKVMFP